MTIWKCFLLGLLIVACSGCAEKQGVGDPAPLLPMPAQHTQVPEKAEAEGKKSEAKQGAENVPPYGDDDAHPEVSIPPELTVGPREGEPDALAELLELKGAGVSAKDTTAIRLMRPAAIREAAQLVTLQTAISWRYKQLLAATEGHGTIMDTAFDFSPLVMTQGEALIMPPVLTRAGASMRIENGGTATAAETTYELLEPARYIATAPHWREFLMMDAFPEPEKPNPAVLPKNNEERAIWRAAVREAWVQGLAEADQLYAENISRMVRSYRGVMLYHLLSAQHLLSRVDTASADLGMHTSDDGGKLNIGQKVYRITAPSRFTAEEEGVPYARPPRSSASSKSGGE